MKKNSQFLARSSFSNVLYGDTPFGREMNKKTIKKIKLKDVQEFYNFYSPNLSELIIVGNVKKDVIYSKLNFLKKLVEQRC